MKTATFVHPASRLYHELLTIADLTFPTFNRRAGLGFLIASYIFLRTLTPMITNSVMTLPIKSNVIQNTKHKAHNYSNTKLQKYSTKKKRDRRCSRMDTTLSEVHVWLIYTSLFTINLRLEFVFTTRRVCIARTMPWQGVCLSVCLSVTCQYCV